MKYWILWLAIGIAYVGSAVLFSLPKIIQTVRSAGKISSRRSFVYMTAFSVFFGGVATVFSWVVAAYCFRARNSFFIGPAEEVSFPLWWLSLIAVGVFLITEGTFLAMYFVRRKRQGETPPSERPKREPREGERADRAVWSVAYVVLVLAIAAATVILTMLLEYLILAKLKFSRGKKALLLGVGLELVALCVLLFFKRKRRGVRRAVSALVPAALFVFTVTLYALLSSLERGTLESVVFTVGAAAFALLPIAACTLLWFDAGRRSTAIWDISDRTQKYDKETDHK